jgi:hypothetical protein
MPRLRSSASTPPQNLSLAGGHPDAQHVLEPVDVHAGDQVGGLVVDRAAVADLDHQRVDVKDGVKGIQRPGLPLRDLIADHVGDLRDQCGRDFRAVDLPEVRLDIPGRHPSRVKRQDHLVDLPDTALPFRDDLRRECGIPVPRYPDPYRPGRRRHRFPVAAVPGITRPVPCRVALGIAEMILHFRAQRALDHLRGQLPDQPVRAVQQRNARLLRIGDHPVDRLIAGNGRQPSRRRLLRRHYDAVKIPALCSLADDLPDRLGLFLAHGVCPSCQHDTSHTGTSSPRLHRRSNTPEKLLESAAIKISSVLSDLHGMTGRDIMDHLIAGQRDPKALADLARKAARRKIPELEEALEGTEFFTSRHGQLLKTMLDRIDRVTGEIDQLSAVIEDLLAPYEAQLQQAESMPGWARRSAQDVIAETGADMTRFADGGHLASWAGRTPLDQQSGKKAGPARRKHGNRYLGAALGETAVAAGKTQTREGARHRRLARKRGKNKACVATGNTQLKVLHALLSNPGTRYQDLGADWYDDARQHARQVKHHVGHLGKLGYEVTLCRRPQPGPEEEKEQETAPA